MSVTLIRNDNMAGCHTDRYILIDVKEIHEKVDVDLEVIGLKEDGFIAEPTGFLFYEENGEYRLRIEAPEPQKKRPRVGDILEIEVSVDPHAREPRVPVHEVVGYQIIEGDELLDEREELIMLNALYHNFEDQFKEHNIEKSHLDGFLDKRDLYRRGIYDQIDYDLSIRTFHKKRRWRARLYPERDFERDFIRAFVENYIIPHSKHREVERVKEIGEKMQRRGR